MKNVTIAICDDTKECRENVISCCEEYFNNEAEILCFSSGEDLLASSDEYDILFLDIEMAKIDGIEVKEQLEAKETDTRIIFLTSHEERVLEAFGKNVIAFLKKPLLWNEFKKTMDKISIYEKEDVVEIDCDGESVMLPVSYIRYVEAQDKYTKISVKNDKLVLRKTMKEWEELLPEDEFCRVNRSYLINLDLIEKDKDEIIIEEGKLIKISRKYKKDIMEKYKNYLRKKMSR